MTQWRWRNLHMSPSFMSCVERTPERQKQIDTVYFLCTRFLDTYQVLFPECNSYCNILMSEVGRFAVFWSAKKHHVRD